MLHYSLIPIFLVVFIDVLGMTIVLPLLPFYSEYLGASPFVIGIMISIYGFCQLLAGVILGQASDYYGRKPILLISQFGTLIGFIVMALAHNLWLLFLARIIDGLTAGNIAVAQAFVSDMSDKENRTQAFGMISAAFGLGFFIGPAITGFLVGFGPTYPIWAATALSALSLLITYLILPTTTRQIDTLRRNESLFPIRQMLQFLKKPITGSLLWQYLIFTFAFILFVSGLALFSSYRFSWNGQPFGSREVGYLFTYAGLVSLIVQLILIPRLSKRFSNDTLVWVGFFCMSVGYAALSHVQSINWLIFFLTFNNFGSSILRPALISAISQSVSTQRLGISMGLAQSMQSLSQIVAPLITGIMIQRQWLSAWAITCACIAAFGGSLALRFAWKNT